MSARLLGAKQRFNKERDSSWQNIYEVLAACVTKLITARARRNKRTARMLPNVRKDLSIPLLQFSDKNLFEVTKHAKRCLKSMLLNRKFKAMHVSGMT